MNAKDTPDTTGTVNVSFSSDVTEGRAISLHVIPDCTGSFLTILDLSSGRSCTVPIIGWDLEAGRPVVLDLGTAELELVQVLDEARERAGCVWSPTTIFEGSAMTAARAEAMLRGHDDNNGGPPPLRVA